MIKKVYVKKRSRLSILFFVLSIFTLLFSLEFYLRESAYFLIFTFCSFIFYILSQIESNKKVILVREDDHIFFIQHKMKGIKYICLFIFSILMMDYMGVVVSFDKGLLFFLIEAILFPFLIFSTIFEFYFLITEYKKNKKIDVTMYDQLLTIPRINFFVGQVVSVKQENHFYMFACKNVHDGRKKNIKISNINLYQKDDLLEKTLHNFISEK